MNKIFSDFTQLQYAYFDLPFVCPPSGRTHGGSPFGSGQSVSLNLGEVLRGDRITTSDFELVMGKNVECQPLCTQEVRRKDVKWGRELIKDGYVAEWIADNLPGATSFVTVDRSRKYYASGFKLGYQEFSPEDGKSRYFLNNHYTIVIRWRQAPDGQSKVIVGFEVYPKSITAKDHEPSGCPKGVHEAHAGLELYIPPNLSKLREKYPGSSYLPEDDDDLDDGAMLKIPYTYSVYFREETGVDWYNRWDLYFSNQEEGSMTHWLAILNSLTISGVLGVAVYVIWNRTIQGDIKGRGDGAMDDGKIKLGSSSKGKNREGQGEGLLEQGSDVERDAEASDDEEPLEDVSGWKLLHSDVFRIPEYSGLLAPLVGSGMQLLFVVSGLLLLSCLGVLNPSFRGGFVSVGMGLFVFAGLFSGYFSGRLYKTLGGGNWRRNTLIVRSLFAFSARQTNKLDRTACPRASLLPHLHPELIRLVPSLQHSHSIWHVNQPSRIVAAHPSPACIRRQLGWLRPRRTMGASDQDQPNRAPGASAAVVPTQCLWNIADRADTVCCTVHRTPLPVQESLAG